MADLTNPNQSLADILNTIKNSIGSPADSYKKPEYTQVNQPNKMGAEDINKVLGTDITYDRNEIENIYKDATKGAYDQELQQQANAEKSYYKQMATVQNTALDTMRQQYGQAIASGSSKGMQAANALSAVLGTSQTTNDTATKLAEDRQALGGKYATQMKKDTENALTYANEVGEKLGNMSHQFYNDDIQKLTAQLSYNQGINTDTAGYEANKYTAMSNLLANLANAGAGVYNNNQSSIAAIQAALEEALGYKYTADKNLEGTVYSANKR